MSGYYYSALTNSFYPSSLKLDYEGSENGWPDDVVAISDEVFVSLLEGQASGKVISADENGKPICVDMPPPAPEAVLPRQARQLDEAEAVIRVLERAVKLGMATDEEKARLEAWERYSVLVSRINPDDAPNISWPDKPE